jgi:hypothetical protein
MAAQKQEVEIFVPGRLCVLGEHSDWAGEYRDINGAISYGLNSIFNPFFTHLLSMQGWRLSAPRMKACLPNVVHGLLIV